MNKKVYVKFILTVCSLFALITMPLLASAAEQLPNLNIKVNGLYPVTSLNHKYITLETGRWIEECVPRAKCTIYPANALVPFQKALEAVQKGLCDFTVLVSGMTPGAHPIHEVVELPFLWPRQAASNAMLLELHRRYPYFLNDFGPEVKHVGSDVTLGIEIHTSEKPIRKLEDLKGMVFGCMTKTEAEALKAVGASAMLVTPQDTYTQLERGTFKGICTAWGNIQAWRIYEITKYHTIAGLSRTTMHVLFNRKTWEKFTPDEQKKLEFLIQGAFPQAHNLSGTLSTIDVVDNYLLKEKGKHEIIVLPEEERDKWKELVKPMWNEWAQRMEAKGYPGKETIQFIERFGKALAEER
jgi:TRAP-type transport system periplasmic protein